VIFTVQGIKEMAKRIFGSRIRAKALGWFYTHTDESFFVRQLASILNEDSTNLSRELSNLEKTSILSSERKGNLKLFKANLQCPFFAELKVLVLKTIGVFGEIKSALGTLDGIKHAFVFGSYAKGEENAQSDIDLMLVGDVDIDKLDETMAELEKKLGRSINYLTFEGKEFAQKRKKKDGFLMGVLNEKKIMLIGDENSLKKA
jgi:predicted nucleotidyltransferase